ncbi:MAG: endonuclease MutS2 [Gemmatimonadota bacterium]|jgi:DNA mismatch repair protein MutS2|nr:endonuclease MutS2 [Gemmatimonadota bacterium]
MNAHTLRILEFDRIRALLAGMALSDGGRRLAGALTPSPDPGEVAERLVCVTEVLRLMADSGLPLQGLEDIESVLERIRPDGAVLTGEEAARVGKNLHVARRVARVLHERREDTPRLADRAARLSPQGPLREEIDRCVDSSGEVLDGASPALRKLRREQEVVRQRLLSRLGGIVRSLTGAGDEPVVTLRSGRFVLSVRRDRSGKLNGVIHGQSGSGASIYLEPSAAVEMNNELAALRGSEAREVRRILTEITVRVRAVLPELKENESCLCALDLIHASGRFSRELECVPALPSEDGALEVVRGAHPLLLLALRETDGVVVPLDFALGGGHAPTLVITGPNTGGKTVALKTVGLFALMNQSGLPLPAAEGTRFPVFRRIHADIGDEQSIERSLSTFSSHMAHVNQVLSEADGDTLVLLDEIGVGTDPEEGAALAKAVLTHLTECGARTVVTTHYGSLKAFAHEAAGMENASLEFDRESLTPTYHFLQGVPGSSEALSVAQRLGFPEPLVDAARRMLGEEKEAVEGLLQDLRDRRAELAHAQADLDAEKQRAVIAREKAEERLRGLGQERRKLERDALDKARRLVEQARAELGEILGAARTDAASEKAAGRARTRLGEMEGDLERRLSRQVEAGRAPERPARAEEITEGTPVLISRVGWKGTALGAPGSSGKVDVAVGSLRVEVPLADLELRARTRAEKRQSVPVVRREDSDSVSEIDLRGKTVDEAVGEVDRVLDGLVVSGGSWVRIIHGKGTGALRSAITAELEQDARVKSFRTGEPAEGGTGVTIAVLNGG